MIPLPDVRRPRPVRRPPEIGQNALVESSQAAAVSDVLARAFEEDVKLGVDLTSSAIFSAGDQAVATVVAKGDGVLAGTYAAVRALQWWGNGVSVELLKSDGDLLSKGDSILLARGTVLDLLKSHRTALSLLSHLSGVATRTRAYVQKTQPFGVPLFYTRKAMPGLRTIEKQAVSVGGGVNHRLGLYDTIKVMDVHVKAAGSLRKCIESIRSKLGPGVYVEAEARSRDDVDAIQDLLGDALDRLWLDNVPVAEIRSILAAYRGRVAFGTSGGFQVENVADFAATGVDCVSVGSGLVLESTPIDLSMKVSRLP